ncbi:MULTISPECIES: HAMP domain-containing sensor histidine kinase [Clostridium]|uniref:histidine kinase n=1 Tax=Clostridium aquiflavi TaxID=3073603 RepID=A0ABU1EGG3_9CLOT|nr:MULTISPECIES: HAMP domain-containing sensor histidine kinase [unclassified Clostridium]MDR5587476.1 HAMP domain-containing sensor histidine kinase [Clostridium sp. 5N-1]NFG63410.1 HAMP domain-containing histidine kinase [Clostridium botulinum]NFQ11104.1 HAMP domain-containing histidine kinase [Clostridium botulinum]
MKINLSFNKIYNLTISLLILLFISFTAFIFIKIENFNVKILTLLFALSYIFLGLIFIILIRERIIYTFKTIDNCIDDMISGKDNIAFNLEDETLVSKFQNKLKKLYNLMLESRNKSEIEKIEIQSLISDISHQVKTPIANLKLYNSTLIERELSKEKVNEFLLLINNQLNKLDFLMQSIIKMSRLETGLISLNIKSSLLCNTIASSLGNIIFTAEKKNLNINVSCDSSLIVKHDAKWTSEAIFNILDNAVKYTHCEGNISISVTPLEIFTKIDISDDGIGINSKNICKIFNRFYREEDVYDISGIGIGLYLSREIISKEGGYIKVSSSKGNGSTFSIFLLNQ